MPPGPQEGTAYRLYQETLLRVSRLRAAIAARQSEKYQRESSRRAWLIPFKTEYKAYVYSAGELVAFFSFKAPTFLRHVAMFLRECQESPEQPPNLDIDISAPASDVTRIASEYANDWWNSTTPSNLNSKSYSLLLTQALVDNHFKLLGVKKAVSAEEKNARSARGNGEQSARGNDKQSAKKHVRIKREPVTDIPLGRKRRSKTTHYSSDESLERSMSDGESVNQNSAEDSKHMAAAMLQEDDSEFEENSSADIGERDDSDVDMA